MSLVRLRYQDNDQAATYLQEKILRDLCRSPSQRACKHGSRDQDEVSLLICHRPPYQTVRLHVGTCPFADLWVPI